MQDLIVIKNKGLKVDSIIPGKCYIDFDGVVYMYCGRTKNKFQIWYVITGLCAMYISESQRKIYQTEIMFKVLPQIFKMVLSHPQPKGFINTTRVLSGLVELNLDGMILTREQLASWFNRKVLFGEVLPNEDRWVPLNILDIDGSQGLEKQSPYIKIKDLKEGYLYASPSARQQVVYIGRLKDNGFAFAEVNLYWDKTPADQQVIKAINNYPNHNYRTLEIWERFKSLKPLDNKVLTEDMLLKCKEMIRAHGFVFK